MSYLLDTNIVSAIAPTTTRPVHVVDWLERHTDDLFLSVITVVEIRDGIAKARREGATRKASTLATWWESVETLYVSRLLPFDLAAAKVAGDLTDRARAQGLAPGFADVALASIAQSRGFTIVTRNTRDFLPLQVALLDPFQVSPPSAR